MPLMGALIFFIAFSLNSPAENLSQLESLEYLQKETAQNIKSAASWSEDMMALSLLSDKLQQYVLLDYYPSKTGQMFSDSFRPRFQISPSFKLNPDVPPYLVPIREAFKKRASPSDPCNQMIYPIPFFGTALDPNVYCLDAAATRTLEVDSTKLTSIQRVSDLTSNAEIQMGYLSVPTAPDAAYFNDPNIRLSQDVSKLSAKRFEFLKFIPYPNEPSRVASIEVKVGSVVAQIPYPEPPFINPQCQITSNATSGCTSLFPGATCTQLNSVTFNLVNIGGVVISASIDGQALSESEIPQQRVQQSKNELLKSLSISDLKSRMKNVQQEPASDYAQGLIEISGQVRGPNMALAPHACTGAVAFRFYNPPAPTCEIALSPADQEPDLPVTATVKVKNHTNSAVLGSSAGGLSKNLTFNPAPSVSQESSTSVSLVKQGDADETISVNVQGPGGTGTCQAPLRFLRPAPPQCNLTASPSTVSACKPDTILTLDCVNRVHSASINGVSVTLNSQGKASIPYTKVGLGSVTVSAEARNRWWQGAPSTPNATVGDNTVAPSCQLLASVSDIMVGQSTNLNLSNIQGCFDENQIDINGTRVNLSGGQASLSYTKQNTQTETVLAHIRGPAGLTGSCPVTLTGFPIPKPSCRLTADQMTLATGESTTLRLSFDGQVNSGETYINGYPGTTYTFTKNTNICGPVTVTGYVVGPGGRSDDCPVTIQHNTPIPACDLSVSPTAGLLAGASTTASLSCSNGRSVGSAVLLDEDKTNEIKSSGATSRTLNNLSAGTHSVRAIIRDECNANILDRTITLTVATPPPPCPFMRENEWINMHSIYQGKPRYVIGNLDRDVASNLTTGNSKIDLGFYNQKGFMGSTGSWEGLTKESLGKSNFQVEDVNHPLYGKGVVWLGRTIIRHNGNPYNGDAGTMSEFRTGDGGDFNLFNRTGTTGTKLNNASYSCRNTGTIDWNGPHPTLQHSAFTTQYDCFDSINNKLYLTSYRKFREGTEKAFLTAEIKNANLASCEISKVVVDRVGGCFVANTSILMADGKEKAISEIRIGDYVYNPHYRMGIRVRKVVKGPEPKPLFEVAWGEQRIQVTEDHPFLTDRGWIQARALKKGDKLFGGGKGKFVRNVRKLPYQKPVDVWNFELDSEESMAHVVIANGIPTGDLVTQLDVKKKPILKAISGSYHNQDFSR